MAGLLPPALLALFALACGTLAGGATALGSAAASLSLLGVAAWAGAAWRDPLGLGRAGRLLPAAFLLAVVASLAASPVPRAGRVGALLLPAFLLLPAAVERCWRREADLRRGLRGVAATVAAVSLWSLADAFLLGAPRPAMPLGHHTLLAAWLVTVLPLGALAALDREDRVPWRALGGAAGLLGAGAVLASRSLAGIAALSLEAALLLIFLVRARRLRPLPVLLAAAALLTALGLFQGGRIADIATGRDPSLLARSVYLEAGWEGFLARPVFGWGPGAAAWTAPAFFDPRPGLSFLAEAVGDLHQLPVQLAYELGLPGLLLAAAIAAVFLLRRFGDRRAARRPRVLAAGLLGLAGAGVASLGTAALGVTALPVAAALAAGAAGAALAGRLRDLPGEPVPAGAGWPARLYALAAALALLPLLAAQLAYERALRAELAGDRAGARGELARAARLDPGFPLYRTRQALLAAPSARGRAAAASLSLEAARDAGAVPALWTVAGALAYGSDSGASEARAALVRACALDPFDPVPPFYLAASGPAAPAAAMHGAHALLADPRLAAAVFWEAEPELFRRSLAEAGRLAGEGWAAPLVSAAEPAAGFGRVVPLLLEMDLEPRLSFSLLVFRRRPWPTRWPLLDLRPATLERLASQPRPPRPALAAAAGLAARFCQP